MNDDGDLNSDANVDVVADENDDGDVSMNMNDDLNSDANADSNSDANADVVGDDNDDGDVDMNINNEFVGDSNNDVDVDDVDEEEDDVDEEETSESHDWHTSDNDKVMNQYNEEKFNIRFKFEQQARFMFGVTMVESENGTLEGKRLPMYTYSGKKIVGMAKYYEGHENAIARARKSKSERTWVKKLAKRPEGHEYYANDSVCMIPKIGKGRES